MDEDWGWLVFGKTQYNRFVEIAIYNLSPDGVPGQNGTDEWGLWVRAFLKQKQFVFFSRTHEIELPPEIASALQNLLQSADLNPAAWQHP